MSFPGEHHSQFERHIGIFPYQALRISIGIRSQIQEFSILKALQNKQAGSKQLEQEAGDVVRHRAFAPPAKVLPCPSLERCTSESR